MSRLRIASATVTSFYPKSHQWQCSLSHVRYLKTGSPTGRLLFKLRQNVGGLDPVESPRLTPQQVTSILRMNESIIEPGHGPVKYFETNKLQSNNPIEDRKKEAKLNDNEFHKYLFGVFDGHAGAACGQAVSERLFNYIALTLASPETLDHIRHGTSNLDNLLHLYHHDEFANGTLAEMYRKSLARLASDIAAGHTDDSTVEDNLSSAFMRLDQDIVGEALPDSINTTVSLDTLQIAFSGSCACVAYIDETDLYVANVGDSRAVLGVHTGDSCEAVELSREHSVENESEVNRLMKSHPNESANLVRGGRLLGDLAPLRAFGDVRYKWAVRDLKHILRTTSYPHSFISLYGNRLIPKNYYTPPYLTAEPEIIHHQLSPKDRFLVIASDGLWEMVSPEKIVQLIAGHMDGRQVLVDFKLPHENLPLKEINDLLIRRKKSLANRPVDSNVATYLLRNALGPEHGRLSAMLTLPESIVRYYRDDITITVIFFDSDYIINKVQLPRP